MHRIKVRLTNKTKSGHKRHLDVHSKQHIVPKGSEKKKSTKVSISMIADVLSIASSIVTLVLAILEHFA